MTDNVITARTIDTICDINEDLKKALFMGNWMNFSHLTQKHSVTA